MSCATLGPKSASASPCPYSKQKTSVAKLMEPGFSSSFIACTVPNPSASCWLTSLIAAAQQTQQHTQNTDTAAHAEHNSQSEIPAAFSPDRQRSSWLGSAPPQLSFPVPSLRAAVAPLFCSAARCSQPCRLQPYFSALPFRRCFVLPASFQRCPATGLLLLPLLLFNIFRAL